LRRRQRRENFADGTRQNWKAISGIMIDLWEVFVMAGCKFPNWEVGDLVAPFFGEGFGLHVIHSRIRKIEIDPILKPTAVEQEPERKARYSDDKG
jgi:hypothetical protein